MNISRSKNPFKRFSSWVGEQVAAPSDYYGNEKNRDTVALAATAGVAVGAAVGLVGGAINVHQNQKLEGVETLPIHDPEFQGFNYRTSEDTYQTCTPIGEDQEICTDWTDGWYHRYSPRYEERVVGSYDTPSFDNSNSWQPLTGGLIGAAAGGLVGLGVGLGINLLRKATQDQVSRPHISAPARKKIQERTSKNVTTGLLVGTAAGAAIGGFSGWMEQAKGGEVTREWDIPVTEEKLMGYIPPQSYENTSRSRPSDWSNAEATKPVYRDVPVYDANGEPSVKKTSGSFDTTRFGPVTGALVGGVVGAGAGIATGVAMSVIQKIAAYED